MRFEDGTSSPDLDHNPVPGPNPKASTPHCVMSNLNHTFDISQILPFMSGTHQDAATITADVLAAVAVQASKEFCCMCEPKMTKLKEGYLADTELVFCSWHVDTLGTYPRSQTG